MSGMDRNKFQLLRCASIFPREIFLPDFWETNVDIGERDEVLYSPVTRLVFHTINIEIPDTIFFFLNTKVITFCKF